MSRHVSRPCETVRWLAAVWFFAAMLAPLAAQEFPGANQPGSFVIVPAEDWGQVMRRLDTLEKNAAVKPPANPPKDDKDKWQNASEEAWKTKFSGIAQGDYVLYPNQDAGSEARFGNLDNYFEVRRLRLQAEGEGYGVWAYRIELDFEPTTGPGPDDLPPVLMRDCWVALKDIPFLGRVRVGNFREAISLEELTLDRFNTFMERAQPNVFVPGRHVGIAANHSVPDDSVVWEYGVYFNDIDQGDKERLDDNQGIDAAARIVTTPWYGDEGRYFLHLGLSGNWGNDRDHVVRFRARPETHLNSPFLETGSFPATSDYFVYCLESAAVLGSLSLQAEFFHLHLDDAVFGSRNFFGAYAYVSYFLTGENRGYRRQRGVFDRVIPNTNFWLVETEEGCEAGWGAWELAVRWSHLDFQDGIDSAATNDASGRSHNLTFGCNWYWNPNSRMEFNWTHAIDRYKTNVNNAQTDIVGLSVMWFF